MTATIPMVMAAGGDPVGEGIVQSLARPAAISRGSRPLSSRSYSRPSAWSICERCCPESLVSPTWPTRKFKDLESPGGRSIRTAAQGLGPSAGPGRIQDPSVHRRLHTDQPRPGRGALRLVGAAGLQRSSSHRGLRDPVSLPRLASPGLCLTPAVSLTGPPAGTKFPLVKNCRVDPSSTFW